jgi:hypothetical protein
MQGTRSKSILCAMIAVAAFWLAAPFAYAVVISSDTAVLLTGSNITLTLAAGGSLPSYSVASSTLTLNLVSGSTVTVKSADLYTLTNSPSTPTLCSGTAYSYVSFTAATSTTVTMTPNTTPACNTGGGGAGGGDGSPYYQISVSKSGTGSGTVSGVNVYGSLNCGSSCTATLLGGSTVTLTATAATSSVFASWGGDCSSATGTVCSLLMNGVKSVGVVFNLTSSTPASTGNGTSGNATGTASSSPSSAPTPPAYCLVNHSGTFYLLLGGIRHGISHPGILYSYGYRFADAAFDSPAYQALPEGSLLAPNDGALVKSPNSKTVYLVSGGLSYGFSSEKVFRSLGFNFSSVLTGPLAQLAALPNGGVISDPKARHLAGLNIIDHGAVSWMQGNQRDPYPSLAVYNSWNLPNDFSKVVPVNPADLSVPVGPAVLARTSCQGR